VFRSLLQRIVSRIFHTDSKSKKLDPLHSFGRWELSVRTFLCIEEASNCSSLHPSGRFSRTFGRHSVFDQLWDFVPKHRYGKTIATVRTMWTPVLTSSSIRQVVHSKSRRSEVSPHGSDTRASYMEIECIRSTVQTTYPMFRTHQGLIWKLRATKVQPSGRQGNTVRTRLNSGKNLCAVVRSDALCLPSRRYLGILS
jgi:hypothetical protein